MWLERERSVKIGERYTEIVWGHGADESIVAKEVYRAIAGVRREENKIACI